MHVLPRQSAVRTLRLWATNQPQKPATRTEFEWSSPQVLPMMRGRQPAGKATIGLLLPCFRPPAHAIEAAPCSQQPISGWAMPHLRM